MQFKLNPITGDIDRVSGNGNYIQKINPVTGKFNLVDDANSYKQIINPLTGNFQLWGEGGKKYTKEVTGNGYIDLTDAVANKLLELKAYGGCEQDLTPTPTTPVDIVCNNGTLKVKKESGLPFRYKKVEYITASGTQWLNTGIKLASTDIVEAEYKNSSTTGFGALYGVFALGDSSAFYANGTYYGYDVSNNKVITGVDVDTARHTLRHNFVNGVITLDDTTTTFTPFTFDNSRNNYLFSRYYNTSYGYGFKGSCRKYKIYRGGELICDLIPVIDTQNNNEPGMYDLVSGEFKGNVGSGNFTAGAEAQDDIEVYVDGTKEKVGYSGGATATCEDLLGVGDYKDEQEILSGNVITKVGVLVLDGTEDRTTIDQYNRVSIVVSKMVAPANPRVIPALCTHFENLHNSESIGDITAGQFYTASPKRVYFHISQSTTAAWKQYLKDQLNAGTPVIVVYPLATPTTLSVAGQTLSIPAGDSRIEIVEGSILDLPLYAKYLSTTE